MIPTVQPKIALATASDLLVSLYDQTQYGKARIRFMNMDLDTVEILRQSMVLSPKADFLSIGGKSIFEARDANGAPLMGADVFVVWPLDGSVEKVTVKFANLLGWAVVTTEEDGLTVTPK